MRPIRTFSITSILALALSGCAPEIAPTASGLVEWERLETDLGPGPARSLAGVQGSHVAWRDETGVIHHQLALDTLEGGRWTMFWVLFEEGPGGNIESESVLGCVGPTRDSLDYDDYADEVRISLGAEEDGRRRGTLHARFPAPDGAPESELLATFRLLEVAE
jgi:hypothetical protein